MVQIHGLQAVINALAKAKNKYGDKAKGSVIVGYTAAYAIYVHENIEMKLKGLPRPAPSKGNFWDPTGSSSKFLEKPAREMRNETRTTINSAMKNGATMEQAMYIAALQIQRASQKMVPVDFGNLKASAFTRKE